MHVAVQLEFKVNRKEPLGDLVRRIASLFEGVGLQPEIQASFADGPDILRKTSAVERAIKKHPHLAALERNDAPRLSPNLPPIRRLTNLDSSKARQPRRSCPLRHRPLPRSSKGLASQKAGGSSLRPALLSLRPRCLEKLRPSILSLSPTTRD